MSNRYKTLFQEVDTNDNALLVKVVNDSQRDLYENRVPNRKYFSNICNTNSTPAALSPLITNASFWRIPSAASVMRIASSNVNDTIAGTGARLILIQGLDANLVYIQEVITMNGQTPVSTSNQYFRINNMFVIDAGTSSVINSNLGIIFLGANTGTFSTTNGFNDGNYCVMRALDNSAGNCLCTIPKGEVFYPLGLKVSGCQNASTQFKFYYRPTVGSGVFNYLDESICSTVFTALTFIGGGGITTGEFLVQSSIAQGTANNPSCLTYAFAVARKYNSKSADF